MLKADWRMIPAQDWWVEAIFTYTHEVKGEKITWEDTEYYPIVAWVLSVKPDIQNPDLPEEAYTQLEPFFIPDTETPQIVGLGEFVDSFGDLKNYRLVYSGNPFSMPRELRDITKPLKEAKTGPKEEENG
jgi:hypothetical protein